MKIFLIILLIVYINFGFNLFADEIKQIQETQNFVRGEIIIKPVNIKTFKDGEKKAPIVTKDFIKKYSSYIESITQYKNTDIFILKTKNAPNYKDLIINLKNDSNIEDASLNYIASIEEETDLKNTPNDPGLQFQYGLNNTGVLYHPDNSGSAKPGNDIKALLGWYWGTGDPEVIIAVLDTGIALDHEDLKNKLTTGYNFIAENDNPYDDHGHGTMVASIAAAETNNGIGMAGVSWNSIIMPVKVMDNEGNGSYLQIAAGIRYAVDYGAKIINLSAGGQNPSFILEDACKYAHDNGVMIIAASGNISAAVYYPAAYDDYCLAVGASDYNDEISAFSNFGPSIDVVAPGVAVFGAVYSPDEPEKLSGYGWNSGTSFAAPFVSGAAAVLMSNKSFLTVDMAMKLIKMTADDVNFEILPGIDDNMGYGRLNLSRLLSPFSLIPSNR